MFAPLFVGVLFGTLQEPNVSLELRGVRLENAAPILAKTFGMGHLEIGPTIKNEVLLVRSKDVSPAELKAKLATALNATWQHRSDGWWFAQTDEQKDAEKKTYNTERYKFYSELVEKSQKKLLGMKPFDEATCKQMIKEMERLSKTSVNRNNNNIWRQISKIDEQSPTSRMAYRMALRITPSIYTKLTESNPRIVFCTKPTAMQQPFPFQINDLIDQAMQDQNQWATYAAGEPLRGPSAGQGDDEGWYSLGELNEHRQPFKSSDFHMITLTLELNNQSLEIYGYDQKGRRTFNGNISFYDYGEEYSPSSYNEYLDSIKKKMVKVTGDAAEYLDMGSPLDPRAGRQRAKALSPSLLEKILNPEKVDPLSIATPDVYFTSIPTPNIVMVLSDYQRFSRFAEFRETRFGGYTGKMVSDDGKWFIFNQPNPIAARKTMPDRKKLGPILRFIHKNKRPMTIEEQADLAMSLPWEQDQTYTYQSHITPIQTTVAEGYNDRMALRIYGNLTTAQRDLAKKGELPLSRLSEEARTEIYRAIFYSQRYESRLEMDYNGMQEMSPTQQKEMNSLQELMWGGIYEEKTFALPTGLSGNFSISITDNTVATLYCGRPQGGEEEYYGGARSMTANQLGDHLFKMTNPTRYRYEVQSYNRIDENNIQLATQRSMSIKMKISPIMHFTWGLSQTVITDPKVYTAKNLPQDILDQIQKGFKQAEKNDKEYGSNYDNNYGGGRPKRNIPPL